MPTKKRLGVIGCGGHAPSHLKFLEGVVVTAIYDPSTRSIEATQKLLEGQPVRVCATPQELIARDDVDAVLILSPDDTHADLLERVVAAGKPVLCEKPLATTPEGLATVIRALGDADAQGTLVASCHPRRDLHTIDLPYGWIVANLARLEGQFGPLKRIGMSSNYPRPSKEWKERRSFLLDKFVHDIDYLRHLLGDLPFMAERVFDSHDYYEVEGVLMRCGHPVRFSCLGMRLHGAKGEFIETVTLGFEHGECVVYTKSGRVRTSDRRTGEIEHSMISGMDEDGYDRVFAGLMRDFVAALHGGPRTHTSDDLRVVNECVVALVAPEGLYNYSA